MKRMQIVAAFAVVLGLIATSAWADFNRERTLTLEPGGSFVLESDIGDVTLTGGSAPGARVVITSDEDLDRYYDFSFDETPRGVRVTIKHRGGMRRWFGGWFQNTRYPHHRSPCRPELMFVSARRADRSAPLVWTAPSTCTRPAAASTSTSIGGNVEGTTSGGGIRMRNVRGDVVASTSGGSITIADVRGSLACAARVAAASPSTTWAATCVLDTSGGSVDVRGAGGRVEASSSGGGVTVRFAPGNSRGGVVSSSGGSVRTELDPRREDLDRRKRLGRQRQLGRARSPFKARSRRTRCAAT